MLLLRRLLRSSRAPYANLRRHTVVWPQILALISLILQPLPLSRAIYIPDGNGNPYWLPLLSPDPEPSGGPDTSDAGDIYGPDYYGVQVWEAQLYIAVQTGAIVWWPGAHRLVDGAWHDLPAAYHLPCGDADSDGIPDNLDPYPDDANNNTFWWGGGNGFFVDGSPVSYSPGYHSGSSADSDSDGIPDGVDPYPTDNWNQNGSNVFYWVGTTVLIAGQWQSWGPGLYAGSSYDSDGDGLPDGVDPYPTDSDNGNNPQLAWWTGGDCYVDAIWTHSTHSSIPPALETRTPMGSPTTWTSTRTTRPTTRFGGRGAVPL